MTAYLFISNTSISKDKNLNLNTNDHLGEIDEDKKCIFERLEE